MQTNSLSLSLTKGLDLTPSRGQSPEIRPSSLFWTRADGMLSIQDFRPETDIFFQPHSYSEYTIVICLEGEIEKSQFDQTQIIGRGGVVIGNHGVEHTSGYWSRNGRRCEAVVLSVGRRLLGALAKDFDFPVVDDQSSPAFLGRLERAVIFDCARVIAEELRRGLPGHQVVVETMATRILIETLRAWPKSNVQKMPADLAPRLPRREFVRAYEFMRWTRKESFRLQQLCRFLGSSEERFTRLFLSSTRHTPASFYNRMLLDRGLDLLRQPKLSIKEIGFELGFKTSSHFIAAFRREFAVSPAEYRNRGSVEDFKLKQLWRPQRTGSARLANSSKHIAAAGSDSAEIGLRS